MITYFLSIYMYVNIYVIICIFKNIIDNIFLFGGQKTVSGNKKKVECKPKRYFFISV